MSTAPTRGTDPAPTGPASVVPLTSGGLPVVGHLPAFVKDPVAVLRRGYTEHGRSFRLNLVGASMVVLLRPEHRKEILLRPESTLSISAAYPFLNSMFGSAFYFMAEDAEYQRQRDLFVPSFRSGALRTYLGVMERQAQRLIARLGDEGEVELVRMCDEFSLRTNASCFFGEEFAPLFTDALELFETFSGNVSFLLPVGLRPLRTRRSRAARRRLHTLVLHSLAGRRARPLTEPDFLQSLVNSRYRDGSPVPDSALVHQALGLLWASQETTAGQLAWALTDVLAHPEYDAALLAEQRAHLGTRADAPLTLKGLNGLTHLDHMLYESERLHPLATLIPRKARQDLSIGGHWIRRGDMVLTSPYLTHRLPEEFPNPEAFRPERYTEDPMASQRLMGFGAGIHRCLGQRFARLETKVLLTQLLRRYTMELLDPATPITGLSPRRLNAPCRARYRLRSTDSNAGYRRPVP
ncbi:cytochrome P450 [Streptomyces sp. NPDC003032]